MLEHPIRSALTFATNMKDNEFRPLTDKELLILKKLSEVNFKGHDQLFEQIQGLSAKTLDKNGSIRLHVQSSSIIPVNQGVLVEARCPDSDTTSESEPHINILLHVNVGKITMLEIYKDDSTDIKGEIDPNKFNFLFSQHEIDD